MKKFINICLTLAIFFSVICIAINVLFIKDYKEDDSIDRTYRNTVYDVAYSTNKKDGLRARAYYRILFSESEHKVIECIHRTAGSGHTKILEGVFEGELGDKVVIKYNDSENESCYVFDGQYMKTEYGKDTYSSKDVKSDIREVEMWD